MALLDLIYRCPACGHDPTVPVPAREAVRCSACGTEVSREGDPPLTLRVRDGGGGVRDVGVAELRDRIDAHGGVLTRAKAPGGHLDYAADVRVRSAGGETPVRYRRRLLGFAEHFGGGVPGRLRVMDDRLELTVIGGKRSEPRSADAGGGVTMSWPLEEIRSLQGASTSVQIRTSDGGLHLFRFIHDSSRRWEELLRHALRKRWAALGMGQIEEFQPRIRATRTHVPNSAGSNEEPS